MKIDFRGLWADARVEMMDELRDVSEDRRAVVEKALKNLLAANLRLLGAGGDVRKRAKAIRNILHVRGTLMSEAAFVQMRLYDRMRGLVQGVLEKALVQVSGKLWG